MADFQYNHNRLISISAETMRWSVDQLKTTNLKEQYSNMANTLINSLFTVRWKDWHHLNVCMFSIANLLEND